MECIIFVKCAFSEKAFDKYNYSHICSWCKKKTEIIYVCFEQIKNVESLMCLEKCIKFGKKDTRTRCFTRRIAKNSRTFLRRDIREWKDTHTFSFLYQQVESTMHKQRGVSKRAKGLIINTFLALGSGISFGIESYP